MPQSPLTRAFAAAAIIAALTSCHGTAGQFDPTKARPNGSASYRFGYNDGCKSAHAINNALFLSEYTRDGKRMDTDPEYKKGWYRGKDLCLAYYNKNAVSDSPLGETQ